MSLPLPARSCRLFVLRRQLGRGFTLVELITTIVLVGILSVVVANRFGERDSFDARAFADQLSTMLHYGQKLAIAQNRPVYVRLNGTSIALCFNGITCNVANDLVPAPAGSNSASSVTKAACNNDTRWYCEGIPASLTLAITPPASPQISGFYFDALGKPFALGDSYPSKTSNFLTLSFRINSSRDGASSTIFVEQETGYVHQ